MAAITSRSQIKASGRTAHFGRALLFLVALVSGAASAGPDDPRLGLLSPGIRQFLGYEQGRMSLSVDPNRITMGRGNTQEKFYAPENGNVFELESYWIDAKKLHAFEGTGLAPAVRDLLYRTRNGHTQIRLFVHPESKSLYETLLVSAEKADSFYATATSSSRSLVVWKEGVPPFIAKVSLNKEVSALVRTIPISEISRSIGTQNTLAHSADILPKGFQWMDETFGTIPQGMARGGMLIRQFPEGIVEGKRSAVPLFALYGGNRAQGPPLLVEMIRKSGMAPSEFIRTRIIEPFAKVWFGAVLDVGFSMEAHAQNTLLELGEDGLPTGNYIFRDLGGFDVDFAYRKQLGIPRPKELPVISDFAKEYHQDEITKALRSSVYNHYEGGFLFNLNRDVPVWMNEGLIPQENLGSQAFSNQLREAMNQEYVLRTGTRLPSGFEFSELPTYVAAARKTARKEIAAKHQPRALGSRLLDRYFGGFIRSCERLFSRAY